MFQIYEPFNRDAPVHLDVPDRFCHVTSASPQSLKDEISSLIELGDLKRRSGQIHKAILQRNAVNRDPAPRFSIRRLKEEGSFLDPKRVCIKDPIGLYAADWLADQHGAIGVVMVRHPCAVVSSYIGLGWNSEMEALKDRPIPSGHQDIEEDIERYKAGALSQLEELILQWRVLTAESLALSKRYEDWICLTHENLCAAPDDWFGYIYNRLSLHYSAAIQAKVKRESSGANAVDPSAPKQHSHHRDSRQLATVWKKRLKPSDIDLILYQAGDLWSRIVETFPARPTVVT